jgi:signal transduction histidine kinase
VTRRLIVAYVTLTVFALALFATPLGITFARREHDRLQFDAERNADIVATLIDDPLETRAPLPTAAIENVIRGTRARVVVVDRNGVVSLDTNGSQMVGRSLAAATDVAVALKGKRVSGRSELQVDDTVVAYATVPSTSDGVVDGAVRIAYPTATLDERVRDVWMQLGLLCTGVLAAVALVGVLLARGVTRPLRNLEHASDRLGRGDLATRLDETDGPEELRSVAATFNRMAGQLRDLIESQSQFVANASHQLRTPLTALRLRLENLEAGARDDDRPAIRAISAEVTRMSQVIDGLLLLASDSARRDTVQPTDMAAIARDRVSGWNDVARDQHVDIVLQAPDSAWATVVPDAAEQLLDNLIDNALNASPAGSPIDVTVDRIDSQVVIRVLDRGPGLDAAARAHAFDRFWRAPNAPPGGTGLGLAIVRQLAEASGGACRLDARGGGGLVAQVTLPALDAEGAQHP